MTSETSTASRRNVELGPPGGRVSKPDKGVGTNSAERASTNTMTAVVQDRYGSADVLRISEVAVPVAEADEVLVRIRAAGLNHADWTLMRGQPLVLRLALGMRAPKSVIRGRDLAGVVESVGDKVTGFRSGDEVYAEVDTGTFADYAVVPERMLALKPRNISFVEAAAVPLAGNTALQGLRDVGKIRTGQSVLINGASGGVGTFAVQIAKAFGAEVTAVCSTRNAEMVRSLGADHVIDYTREDFTEHRGRYDLIFDLVGNHKLRACRRALTPSGTLVLSSGTGSRMFGPIGRILRATILTPFVSQKLRPLMATPNRKNLETLKDLIESGRVTPAIERTYPLADAQLALRHFEEEHARSKVVITT